MKMRQLGIQKCLSVVALAASSILPASAHYVYDTPAGAAHNLEHLAPVISMILLLLALSATAVYCWKQK